VRLLIVIILVFSGFVGKSNLPASQLYLNKQDVQPESQPTSPVFLLTKKPVDKQQVQLRAHNSSLFIVNSNLQFSFASKESRHFLDAFFISHFDYFATYKPVVKKLYSCRYIALNRLLMVIYPYHSFW
jgi:hypothetical protein